MSRHVIAFTSALILSLSSGEEKPAASADTPAKPAEPRAKTAPESTEELASDLPTSLSKSALCSELKFNARAQLEEKNRLDQERAALKKEKARLEEMLKEIEKARSDLRAETKRLEQLIAKADNPSGDAAASQNPSGDKKSAGKGRNQPPARDMEEDWEALAKTVKSMKPEQAAALLSKTKKSLTAEVLRRMKPSDAGAVIERLKPDLAAELLANMVSEPETQSAPVGDTKKDEKK